jgi:hypothetical protein
MVFLYKKELIPALQYTGPKGSGGYRSQTLDLHSLPSAQAARQTWLELRHYSQATLSVAACTSILRTSLPLCPLLFM